MGIRWIGTWRRRHGPACALLFLGFTVSAGAAEETVTSAADADAGLYTDMAADVADMPIWRSIALGTHRSAADLHEALDATRCHIGSLAGDILDGRSFMVSAKEMDVDLVLVTAVDLDLGTEDRSLAEIYERAGHRGLHLCSAEVAAQLRLQYQDQPQGEFLHIAMEPIAVGDGRLAAFIVGNGGAGLLLIAGDARPDLEVPATLRFVFIRPR